MDIKEEILKGSGLEAPVRKPKPRRKKKIQEKVKLSSVLNDLLLEAVDLADGSKVIRALERGQIPNVKKKVFLKTSFSKEQIEEALNNAIGIVSSKVGENDKNKYLFLLFKRAGNIEWLDQFSDEQLNEIVDSMMAYFGNKNKKEAKENEEIKKKFEEYENSKLSFEDDKKFEQWANEKFAHKAKAKDKDVDVVYDDGEWSVSIPKTFAAAKNLACMADRKARWCTAASEGMFKNYSGENNPLFIIRNEKRDLMYQMDFGKRGSPNFMNEKDAPVKVNEILNLNIPEDLWKSIKNQDGESVYEKLKPALEDDDVHPLDDTNRTPEENLNGWRETVFTTVDEFMKDVEGKTIPQIFTGEKNGMRDILSGDYQKSKTGGAKRIAKYEKGNEVYYHIVPHGGMALNVRTENKAKIVLRDNNDVLSYITTDELLKLDLPKFFTDTNQLSNTERTEGDMNGWNEYIFSSVGEFLREISSYSMPDIIGDAQSLTRMLKYSYINQIGKVSKGKKVYYYIIPKPGQTITLGSTSRDIYGGRGKDVERIAFQLTKNKLTMKTAKTISQSDLPDVLKEKLFTRYSTPMKNSSEAGEMEKQSLSSDQLKKVSKSEMPVATMNSGTSTLYTNVNTFGKIMNVPNIGENAIESVKKGVMEGRIKPNDVVAVITKKYGNEKYIILVKNNGEFLHAGKFGLDSGYIFNTSKSKLSFGELDYVYDNFVSKHLPKKEKETYEKMKKENL